ETSKPTKWVIMAELRWRESPGNAAQIAALSDDQAPTAITGCPHMARITGQRRPDRGTIGRSGAHRDYRMST
ncbi:MAG: hypothetical protein WBO09_14530, partial [Methylocystis silviterrae]|uniref:hypothetical protein n=1 Tax=Methylocystis silviterrae TaxID=2743612 RepID=UPI003C778039